MDLEKRIEQSKRKFVVNTVICGTLILAGTAIILVARFVFKNQAAFILAMLAFLIMSIAATVIYMIGVVEYNSLIRPRICEAQLVSRKYYDEYSVNNKKKSNVTVYEFKIIRTGEQVRIIEENITDESEKISILGTEKDIVKMYSYRKILGSGYDIKNYYEINEYYDIKDRSEFKAWINDKYKY